MAMGGGGGGIYQFQSTRPRGARHYLIDALKDRVSFNPRARVGRDCFIPIRYCRIDCFNPRARVGRDRSIFRIL